MPSRGHATPRRGISLSSRNRRGPQRGSRVGVPAWGPGASESMRIINGSDKRAIGRLLARGGRGDRALDRRVRTIVDRVRSEGDRALLRFARAFDGVDAPLEVTAEEMREQASRYGNFRPAEESQQLP